MSTAMRYSHQRQRILEAVKNRCDHPTAAMVFEELRMEMPRLSLGTVYRNLNQLSDAGKLRKIPLADGSCRFDGNLGAHSHIVCTQCGTVADVMLPELPALTEAVNRDTNFDLHTYEIVMHGCCSGCAY